MRRPDVSALDYSHPLAHGLVFAGLGRASEAHQASTTLPDLSLAKRAATQSNESLRPSWLFDAELGRYAFDVGENTSKVFVGKSPVLTITGVITLCAWQKLVNGRYTQSIFRRNGYYVELSPYGVASRIYSGVADTSVFRPGGQSVANGVWAHIAMTYDGETQAVYMDGMLIGSRANIGALPDPSYPFWYGGSQGFTTFCSGVTADPLVYGRALSPAEIAILADRTDPMIGGLIVEDRPVLYFDLGSVAPSVEGPATVTASASLGMGGVKQALASLNIVGSISPEASGIKSTSSHATITAAATIAASGIKPIAGLDKDGSAVITASSTVGVGGVKGGVGAAVLGADTELVADWAKGAIGQALFAAMGEFYAVRGPDGLLIAADEIGRSIKLQGRNYTATLAARNYTARLS